MDFGVGGEFSLCEQRFLTFRSLLPISLSHDKEIGERKRAWGSSPMSPLWSRVTRKKRYRIFC